jgi:hypothetical protein
MESEKLYSIYSNKSPSEQGILARNKQRMRWLRSYQRNGSCQRKLEKCGVLKRGDE